MPRALWSCVILVILAVCQAQNSSLTCCMLWNSFVKHISSATDQDGSTCDEVSVCQSSRVQTLYVQVNAFHQNILRQQSNQFTMSYDPPILADLLVLSMLGRLVTKQDAANAENSYAHYVFNEVFNTLQPVYSNCKFEKTMYVSLLCVTIVILISLLVMQLERGKTSEATPKPSQQQNFSQHSLSAFTVSLPSANNVRYRAVSQS